MAMADRRERRADRDLRRERGEERHSRRHREPQSLGEEGVSLIEGRRRPRTAHVIRGPPPGRGEGAPGSAQIGMMIRCCLCFMGPLGMVALFDIIRKCQDGYDPPTQTAVLLTADPSDKANFLNFWSLKHHKEWQDWQDLQKDHLEEFIQDVGGEEGDESGEARISFHTFTAKAAIDKMYEGTRVPKLFDEVPEHLRGVFWMRGNGVAEELVTIQYGKWFEKEKIFVSVVAPYSWAWPWGTPSDAPLGGMIYGKDEVWNNVNGILRYNSAFSYKFRHCEDEDDYCSVGGPTAYADMQNHPLGYLGFHVELGGLVDYYVQPPEFLKGIATGHFTLEEMVDNAVWKRTNYWGVGKCQSQDFGSYDLHRITDQYGKPFQPYYDEFLEYMGDVPLLLFTGYPTEQDYLKLKYIYESRQQEYLETFKRGDDPDAIFYRAGPARAVSSGAPRNSTKPHPKEPEPSPLPPSVASSGAPKNGTKPHPKEPEPSPLPPSLWRAASSGAPTHGAKPHPKEPEPSPLPPSRLRK